MRIDGKTRISGVGAGGAAARSSGAGGVFAPDMGAATARAASVNAPMATTSIAALLALQAVEDPLLRKKKAIRRGRSMLDTLDALKLDLMMGRVSESRLNQLMALIGQAREKSLPDLDAVLDDIELRARVELAKLGQFPKL